MRIGARARRRRGRLHRGVWCAGGPDEVIRWDGANWSRVGVSGAIKPRVIATPRAVYFGGTSQSVLLR